jgi:hypothetical protein
VNPKVADPIAHARTGLILDAHMIVLFVVGSFDKNLIPKFKRTKTYTTQDFDILKKLLSSIRRIIVTPHILAETNSLLGQLPENICTECRRSQFLKFLEAASEEYVPSRDASAAPTFTKFGLSDSTIFVASEKYAVLTDDFPLAGILQKLGRTVINFNHLRNFH